VNARQDPAVTEFIAGLPPNRRPMIEAVHQLVREAAPDLTAAMWKNMIGYGTHHYGYASGREGDWFAIGLANQKRYVSLYLCAAVDGEYLADANASRLGNVSVGKSCIRFTKLANLDLDVVRELVTIADREAAAGHFGA
jgi:hypothetical protein